MWPAPPIKIPLIHAWHMAMAIPVKSFGPSTSRGHASIDNPSTRLPSVAASARAARFGRRERDLGEPPGSRDEELGEGQALRGLQRVLRPRRDRRGLRQPADVVDSSEAEREREMEREREGESLRVAYRSRWSAL